MGVRIGRNARIYSVTMHDCHNIQIMDGVHVNEGTVIFGGGGVVIESNAMISSNCNIYSVTHDVDAARKGLLYRETVEFGVVTIGKNSWVGAGVSIMPGTSIGENSIVGAGSVVVASVPPNCVYAGVPAKFLRNLDG